MAYAQFLNSPLKRRLDEENERTQLLVVWTKGKENEERKKEKLLLPPSICQLLCLAGLNVNTEITADFLYLPSYFFPPQTGEKTL